MEKCLSPINIVQEMHVLAGDNGVGRVDIMERPYTWTEGSLRIMNVLQPLH